MLHLYQENEGSLASPRGGVTTPSTFTVWYLLEQLSARLVEAPVFPEKTYERLIGPNKGKNKIKPLEVWETS